MVDFVNLQLQHLAITINYSHVGSPQCVLVWQSPFTNHHVFFKIIISYMLATPVILLALVLVLASGADPEAQTGLKQAVEVTEETTVDTIQFYIRKSH